MTPETQALGEHEGYGTECPQASPLQRYEPSSSPNTGGVREAVARIISPLTFQLSEALENAQGEPPDLRTKATKMRDEQLAIALAKADAILALPVLSGVGGEEDGSSQSQPCGDAQERCQQGPGASEGADLALRLLHEALHALHMSYERQDAWPFVSASIAVLEDPHTRLPIPRALTALQAVRDDGGWFDLCRQTQANVEGALDAAGFRP